MSQPFDPYYTWLGIRKQHQPPNHYRLLGLDLFEDDPTVIENAADRQMAHVRTFQTGEHADASQRLLNEISAAKVCLLMPERKAEYDRVLYERVAPSVPPAATAEAAPVPVAAVEEKPPWQRPAIIGTAVGALAVLLIGMIAILSGGGEERVVQVDAASATGGEIDDQDPTPAPGSVPPTEEGSPTAPVESPATRLDPPEDAPPPAITTPAQPPLASDREEPEIASPPAVREADPAPTAPLAREPAAKPGPEPAYRVALDSRGYIDVENTADLIGPDDTYTAEAWLQLGPDKPHYWFMTNTAVGTRHPSVAKNTVAGWALVYLREGDGFRLALLMRFHSGDKFSGPAKTLDFPDDMWQHVAVCMSPDYRQVFINGRPVFKNISDNTFTDSPANLCLGAPRWGEDKWQFDGQFRAFRLSKSIRYRGPFDPPTRFSNDGDTLSLLDFSEPQPDGMADASGHGRAGLLQDGRWIAARSPLPRYKVPESERVASKPTESPSPNASTKPDTPEPSGTAPPPDSERRSVPAPAELRKTVDTLREFFAADYREATSKEQKSSLAEKLYAQSLSNQNDPMAQYALLDEARRFAAEAVEVELAFKAIDEVARWFEVNGPELKEEALGVALKEAVGSKERIAVASAAQRAAERAADEEQYRVAERMMDLAASTFSRARAFSEAQEARARLEEISTLKTWWEAAQRAGERLDEQPDDPNSHLLVGRYYCFARENWERGLPHLAKCSDADLAALAQQELDGKMPQQIAVAAGAWFEWAEEADDGLLQNAAWLHSHSLYRRAASRLAGLDKLRVEKELEKFDGRIEVPEDDEPVRLPWLDKPAGEVFAIAGHAGAVWQLAVSPSGNLLASATTDGDVRIWSLAEQGKAVADYRASGSVRALAITPSEEYVVVGGSWQGLLVISAKTGELVRQIPTRSTTTAFALTPDGKKIVWCGNTLVVWDAENGRALQTISPLKESIKAAACDERYYAIGSSRFDLTVASHRDGRQVASTSMYPQDRNIRDLAFVPGQDQLVVASERAVRVWDFGRGHYDYTYGLYPTHITAVAVTADGRRFLGAGEGPRGSGGEESRAFLVWDLATGNEVHKFSQTGAAPLCSLVALPDPRGAVTGDDQGTIRVWRLPD